jgi:hypothetical protein
VARARAGARAGAWAWAWRRMDWYGACLTADMAEERGEKVWNCMKVGEGVLIECPSRWYLGVVTVRSSMTVELDEGLAGHDLGDFGMFLEGEISESTELTPLPRKIEISLSSIDSAQPYPVEMLRKIRKRTHQKQGKK